MEAMWGMVGLPQSLLNNQTPVSLLRTFFTEEIFNLIPDQTNTYGKGKKQSQWKDVSKKEIESFLRLIILMGINHFTNRKLYWSKDMLFHQTFINLIVSPDRFLIISIWLRTLSRQNDNLKTTVKFTKCRILLKFSKKWELCPLWYNRRKYDQVQGKIKHQARFTSESNKTRFESLVSMWSNHCRFIQLSNRFRKRRNNLPLGECLVFDLISAHHFQGKHLYFSLLLDD